jgi:hypothetical protein
MQNIHNECKIKQQNQIKELKEYIDKIKELLDDHKEKDNKHFKYLYI